MSAASKSISTKIDNPIPEDKPRQSYQNKPIEIKIKPTLQQMELASIAKYPVVFSIGNSTKLQSEKVEMLINSNITDPTKLLEENIVIITGKDGRAIDQWVKKYPRCFCYDQLDDGIIYYLTPTSSPKQAISKLIVFDQCLTKDAIETKDFKKFMDIFRKHRMGVIVITKNADIIRSDLSLKFDHVLVNSFPVEWSTREKGQPSLSDEFVKRHGVVGDQKNLENFLVKATEFDNCLCFKNDNPDYIGQF
jgi:hypothetical protein